MEPQQEIEQLMAPDVQGTWDSGAGQSLTPEQQRERDQNAQLSGDEIASKDAYASRARSDIGTGIEFYHADPEVRITQKINQAQADNASKKRVIDQLSAPMVAKDYQDSIESAKAIQDHIDSALEGLNAPPPSKQMGQMSMGELIATAAGMLLSHGNAFNTGPMLAAGMDNAQKRADTQYQNSMQSYEAKRQSLLAQLKEAYSQLSDEHQRGYGFQQAGIHGAQQIEQLQQQGINSEELARAKSESTQAEKARGVISKRDSSPQARQQAMDDLEAEFYRSGGSYGQLFTPEQRAANLQSNYYQSKIEAQTGLIDKQGRLVDAKVLTEGARQTHLAKLDEKVAADIARSKILNGLTNEQIANLHERTALLPKEFQLKSANIHSQIYKRQASGQQNSGGQVRDWAALARIIEAGKSSLDKARDPFTHQFADPEMQKRYEDLDTQLGVAKSNILDIAQHQKMPIRPYDKSDEDLKAEFAQAMKDKRVTADKKAALQQMYKAWGIQ